MKGQCLCEAVVFEFEAATGSVFNCHCSRCRKSHGATFATQIVARKQTLRILRGVELISEYESDVGMRCFCSVCGSRLFNYAHGDSDYMSVALAAVEGEHDLAPVAHAYAASKAPWHELDGELPSFDEVPPQARDFY